MSALSCDIDAQVVIAIPSVDLRSTNTCCCCSIAPAPLIVVTSVGIDGNGVITRAGIDGGIESTESTDIALTGSVGVDVEAVVAAA